jgi:hypothetical protein
MIGDSSVKGPPSNEMEQMEHSSQIWQGKTDSSQMRRGTGNRTRRTSVHQNALRNTFHASSNVGGSLEYAPLERRSTDTKLKTAQEDEITRFACGKFLPSSTLLVASEDETSASTTVRPANLAVDVTPDHSSLGNDDLSPTRPRQISNSLAAKGRIKSFRSTDDGSGEFSSTSVHDNRGNLKRKVSMIQGREFTKPLIS